MKRREFIAALGGAAAWPLVAHAQQGDRVRALQVRMLLKAEVVADMIGQFIRGIEAQVGQTTQGALLLRQVPAITEFSQLDPAGHEQLRISRFAKDVVERQTDYSKDPKFTERMRTRSTTARCISPAQLGPMIPASPI